MKNIQLQKKGGFLIVGIFFLWFSSLSIDAYAGAWTMKPGKMYNRVSFNYYESNRRYDESGDSFRMPNHGRFYDRNVSWYEEYGISHHITFISSVYYKWLSYHDDYVHNKSQGVGDLELGLRYRLYQGKFVLSIQCLGKYGELYSSRDPELGDGQNDLEFRILAGKSLWPFPGYVGLEVGYRYRSGAPSDEIRYLAEFGLNLKKGIYGRIKLDGILGVGNADQVDSHDGTNPSIAPEYDLIKLDMTLGWNLGKDLGLEFQYTPSVYGERIGKGWTGSVALVYEF